jgi:arsenate reductase
MIVTQKKVLVLCTGNSARSQMAEVLWNKLGEGVWQAFSAGSKPSGFVHPLALEALTDVGLPTDGLISKHVSHFADEQFDLVVTVCDNAKESCPLFPGSRQVVHWPFEDPAASKGEIETQRAKFREVRDQIAARIAEFLRGG